MICKIWGFVSVMCMALLCACSSDEPVNKPEQEENKTPVVTPLKHGVLLGQWQGSRYVVTGDTYVRESLRSEELYIDFFDKNMGTMTYKGVEGKVSYSFTYNINGNNVECLCNPVDAPEEESLVLNLKYDGKYLQVTTPGLDTFVVSKDYCACTDRYGNVIKDNDKYLYRIWIHENGKNIMDLRNMLNIQLKEAGTKKYNFVKKTGKLRWEGEWISYYNNIIFINSFEYIEDYSKPFDLIYDARFRVIELTEDKLVLSSSTLDTYYPGDESDLPQITDVMEVLTFPTKWKCKTRSLVFNEDHTCQLTLDNAYKATGTYKIDGDKLHFEFDRVEVEGSDDPIEGFVNNQPRKVTCTLFISKLDKIQIDFPSLGNLSFYPLRDTRWELGW